MSAKKKTEGLKKQLGIARLLTKTNEVANKVKANASPAGIALPTGQNTAKVGGNKAALVAEKIATLPKSYKDFTNAADYLADLDRAAGGVATSDQIKATMDQLRKEITNAGADESAAIQKFEQGNARAGAYGVDYSQQINQLNAQRIVETAPLQRYYNDLEVAYYERLEKEKQEKREQALSPYQQLRNNADFGSVVAAGLAKDQPEYERENSFWRTLLDAKLAGAGTRREAERFQESLENPALWAAQNSAELLKEDARYSSEKAGLSDGEYLYMTDEELQIYTYLAETQGRTAADEYFAVLQEDLGQRRQERRYQSQAEWAKEHPWAASFASFGTSLMQPVGYIGNAADYLINGKADINSIWNAPAQLTSAYREGATSNIYNDYSALEQEILEKKMRGQKVTDAEYERLEQMKSKADALAFLANTGYSMGDNLAAMLLGGGGAGSAVLMGGEAAGATAYQSLRSGKTSAQALADGGVSALVEAATERWSLGNLKMLTASSGAITKQSVKAFIRELGKNMAKQGVVEASEEAISEYANTIYDIVVNGESSEYNQYYASLLLQGVPADEAEQMAYEEFFVNRVAGAALGGGISGLFFGGGGTAVSAYNKPKIRNQGDLAAATEASARDTAASMLNMTEAQRAAADTLAEISQRDNAGQSTIADVVASKILTGTNPTNSEIRKLRDASGPVQKAFETMTGIKLTGVDSSTLRAAIGAAAKNPVVDMGLAGQYFGVVNGLVAQMPAVEQATPQYDAFSGIKNERAQQEARGLGGVLRDLGSTVEIDTFPLETIVSGGRAYGTIQEMYDNTARSIVAEISGTPQLAQLQAEAREAHIGVEDHVADILSGAASGNPTPANMQRLSLLRDGIRAARSAHGVSRASNAGNYGSNAVENIDAARQGGAPLDVAFAPDTGSAASMAEDFRQRQHAQRDAVASTSSTDNRFSSIDNPRAREEAKKLDDALKDIGSEVEIDTRELELLGARMSPATAIQRMYEAAAIDVVEEIDGTPQLEEFRRQAKDAYIGTEDIVSDILGDIAKGGDATSGNRNIGLLRDALRNNRNPTDNADIRFRLTGNQYDAPALEYALEEDTLNDAQLANLTGQLRDRGIDLSDDPNTQELLEAVDMLDNMEPGFVLNITEKPYKTAEQKAAEKAEREKAAADRAERKRLADEEKQRKAEEAEKKKAAIAERRAAQEKKKADQEKKKADTEAVRAENRIQREIVKAAKDNISGTMRIKGSGKDAYSVNIVDIKSMVRSLSDDARAEVMKQLETINQLGKAFGHTVRYFSGKMSGVNGDVYGFYHNGIIYANVNYLRAAGVKTVAHEICHDIAASEPSFVSTFYKLYREYCESNDLMSEFNRRWDEVYNNALYPNKQLAITEEVLAEMFGEYAENDSDFLNYCMGKRPGIVARIVEAFNRLLTKLHLKQYSKAVQDAMELRNYMLGVMAQHQLRRTDRSVRLSSAVRSDYAAAQRKADAIGNRYAVRGDAGVHLAQWDTTGLASPEDYKNLRRTAPNEVTDYGFWKVLVGGEPRNVLIVNPFRYITEGYHADMVASSRSLAAALGIRLGFITGQTTQTVGEGRKRRDITIDADYLLTNDGTLFINLDSEVPYNKIVAGAWWSQYRKKHPQSARNMERLVERVNKLRGGTDTIAQNAAVDMLAGKAVAKGVSAINMDVDSLVKALADNKSAAYAYAHENPGIMRRLFENAGDMVAKLTKKQDYRAAYLGGQLQARLMKAFSESSHDPSRRGGERIESDGRRKAPENVWFMSAGENAQTADRAARRDNNAIPREPTRHERRDSVDTYKRRDLRAKISKGVKALNAALTTPSDKKHIPPKLTAAVADFLKEFTNDTSVFSAAKLATLRQAYDRLSDSGEDSDMDISYAYDPDISAMIGELSDTIDGRRLAQLDIDETTKVKNIVQHFQHIVREENGVFVEGRRRNVVALGTEIMGELGQRKAARTNPTSMRAFEAFKDMLTSGNITPAYFFKRIGGAMEQLFKIVRNGQNDWANNMKKARQVYESAFKKYHADSWLNKKGDTLTFESERGDNITLTRQQALTLYATHQREVTNQIQEAGHLSLGGFVYEDAVKSKRGQAPVDTTKAHPLSTGDMAKIIDWLTDEQIKFADEMVGYMSGDLAKLGNETSMQLHGWEKFTESYYFPYNSAENYLYTKQAVSDDRRLKHMSFTKATVRKANNPIVLSDFTQVWANHVQNMLMYSSLAVPLENFNRVYNYKTSVTEDSTSRSVKEALEKAYGKRANAYINQLLADINGGVRPNPSETFIGSMLSKFKKSAVFASASVVVQQPSAIGRAMALIHPKYFVATTFNRRMWEECKEHCGVALIKEMGRFDTNTGRGASEWLIAQPYKGVQKIGAFVTDSEYRDEVLSSSAAKADAYTWASIWNACKREAVKEKGLKPNSEELFKAAAERFDEVINFTQVYDSVFARSELMRSKSVGSQMLTSFMAEPTVSYNLLYDAFANAKRGDVKSKVHPARAVGAFILSATLNSILKSIVTAARDDDEDKTYIEKYLGELVENFSSDANPLNLIPYVRDVLSLIRGYSVDNSAYELPSMIIDAVDDLDNEKKTGAEKLRGLAEAISATFGVPLKNVLRDIDAITDTFFNTKPLTETSRGGILDSVLDKMPFYDNGNAANYARLYDAYIKGDAERADRISGRLTDSGVSESDIMSGLRKAAKEQYIAGGVSSDEASDFLAQHAGLDQNEAYWKVREWDYDSTKSEGDPNYSKYLRLRDALDADDLGEAHDAAVELLEHGVSVSSLKRELTSHLGSNQIIYELGLEDYLDGNVPKKDTAEEANEEQKEDSGKRRGGRGGRGGSSATAAVTASTDASATATSTELPSIGSSEPLFGRRTAMQRVQKSIPGASSATPLGAHAFGSASGGGRIYNEACDNFDGGQCRIGRSSCDGCSYATN